MNNIYVAISYNKHIPNHFTHATLFAIGSYSCLNEALRRGLGCMFFFFFAMPVVWTANEFNSATHVVGIWPHSIFLLKYQPHFSSDDLWNVEPPMPAFIAN